MDSENKPYTGYFEMATSLRNIASDCNSISWNLHEHLVKLYEFPNSRPANHWKSEIVNYMRKIRRKTSGTNKIPKPEFYLKHLWLNFKEDGNDYFFNIKDTVDTEYEDLHQIRNLKFEDYLIKFEIVIQLLIQTLYLDKDEIRQVSYEILKKFEAGEI